MTSTASITLTESEYRALRSGLFIGESIIKTLPSDVFSKEFIAESLATVREAEAVSAPEKFKWTID
jgi:hypothetical protein